MTRELPSADLALALGYLVIDWAAAENQIDALIAEIYIKHQGAAIDPQQPIALARKLRFLKRAIINLPPGNAAKETGQALIAEALELAQARHWCVHAYPLHHPTNPLEFLFGRFRLGTTTTEFQAYSLEQINRMRDRVNTLALNLTVFGRQWLLGVGDEEIVRWFGNLGYDLVLDTE